MTKLLEAYRIVAVTEGIFCEPAPALKYIRRQGYFKNKELVKVICILTGHGLKDTDTTVSNAVKPKKIKANNNIINVIGL